MKVRLLLFASLREVAGSERLELEVPAGTTAGGLWELVVARYSGMEAYAGSVQVAVNQDFADPDREIRAGDEVAFLPPVSGGS